ncbi:hypothetical protein [Janthinobacterium sp. B9-8]|uniref:hypothetical protein n=1 Tax=Janthinobacterium sp. B9-8 TaxID=1236179 RepID=UPI00061D02E2|nr:hypothetical protein [Janthinobacterium sp. B9-8]AMC34275.1 hypothetical protein VN23_06515 [Janthinobacterium sp. B9-8]
MRHLFLILLLSPLITCTAHAASWQICDLEVHVNSHKKADRQMDVSVLKRLDKSAAECPTIGEQIIFRPETADFQSELPKKYWPKSGAFIKMRYQYLDGICKDRGPCRIKHYPLLR